MLPGSLRCQAPRKPSSLGNTALPLLALAAAGSPQVILMVWAALPFTSTFTHRAASLAVASHSSISNGSGVAFHGGEADVLALGLGRGEVEVDRVQHDGHRVLGHVAHHRGAGGGGVELDHLRLAAAGGRRALAAAVPSGEPDPPAPPLPPEPLPPEPPLAELPPLPPLALEPPLPPLVLLPPEPPVEPPVEPPDPAVLPPLPPVRDPPLPPLPPVALLPPLPPWLPPLSGWGQPAARVMVKTIPARSRRECFRMAGTYRHHAFASKRYRDFRRK